MHRKQKAEKETDRARVRMTWSDSIDYKCIISATSVRNEKSRCQTINERKIQRHNIMSSGIINEDEEAKVNETRKQQCARNVNTIRDEEK